MMSLLAFSSVGLAPISTALSGALIELNTTAVFVGAGFLMTAVVLVSAHNPMAWQSVFDRLLGQNESAGELLQQSLALLYSTV